MVPNKAQFDDRIRNLIALAEDNSVESRTLLFSHICDLFIQGRPMESENQLRMLTEITNELISDVEVNIRIELRNILLNMDSPPETMIKLISEDSIEVSGKLLEDALIDEEQLLYLIRYASDDHRDHIGRRFGLSPLLRNELVHVQKEAERAKLTLAQLDAQTENVRVSLQELEKADQNSTELNEDITASILKVLRSKKNEKSRSLTKSVLAPITEPKIAINNTVSPENDHEEPIESPLVSLTSKINPQVIDDESVEFVKEAVEQLIEKQDPRYDATSITDEWFWEIDRYGNISFLSDNAEAVFLQSSTDMIGEDFLSLWQRPDNEAGTTNSLMELFEQRLPFRGEKFTIMISPNVIQNYKLSATATFDIESGRFIGFRGSALIDENNYKAPLQKKSKKAPIEIANDEHHIIDLDETVLTNHIPEFSNCIETMDIKGEKLHQDDHDEVASELLQNLSHEFRTPLNAIIGFSQMIDSEMWGPVSSRYRKNTKDIIHAANHLKDTVNNILDSAKIDAGLIEPTPESFSLKSAIQDSMVAVSPIFESKEIKVSGIDDNIDVILYNDKYCITLCLIKMLSFATNKASIGDDLHLSVLVNSNAEVRIEIPLLNQDINAQNSDSIFTKMLGINKNNLNKAGQNSEFETKISSGFGLSVAQNIAKIIGGNISTLTHNNKISHIVLTISTFPI